jgi:hypothetical protein
MPMTPHRLPLSHILPGLPDGTTVADFWAWAYSDVLTNTTRAVYAEYLVASALGLTDAPRDEWGSFDLLYGGRRIEVKASAYIQAWAQATPTSRIVFNIAAKFPWDPDTNSTGPDQIRSADCYVFCLFTDTDRSRAFATVLDAAYWRFFVLPTARLNGLYHDQKSIGLAALQAACGHSGLVYARLRTAIDAALGI